MPRMIDADALTSVLEEWEEKACDGTENDGSDGTTRVLHPVPTTTSEMIGLIADQPTIEAEPVKHERWENVIESVSVMSCTGFPLTTTAETCTGCLFRSCFVGPKALLHDGICPNCGAKMDGG